MSVLQLEGRAQRASGVSDASARAIVWRFLGGFVPVVGMGGWALIGGSPNGCADMLIAAPRGTLWMLSCSSFPL
jgi:hypothetical protein